MSSVIHPSHVYKDSPSSSKIARQNSIRPFQHQSSINLSCQRSSCIFCWERTHRSHIFGSWSFREVVASREKKRKCDRIEYIYCILVSLSAVHSSGIRSSLVLESRLTPSDASSSSTALRPFSAAHVSGV